MIQPLASVRMGEDVTTWSTLLESSYTPTKRKPWQGIWVGDYSAHGCEFLLVLHKGANDRQRGRLTRRSSTASGLPSGIAFVDPDIAEGDGMGNSALAEDDAEMETDMDSSGDPNDRPSGRIEAIKLTGDINVPRGQCTWFADEIGDEGLVRIAHEELFQGARIVRSMGHVADRGFKDDRFISSQLIMKDPDTLAQYWEVSIAPSSLLKLPDDE